MAMRGDSDGGLMARLMDRPGPHAELALADLAERIPDDELPPLDRAGEVERTAGPYADWQRDGAMILPGRIPADVVDAYCERFRRDALSRTRRDGGSDEAYRSAIAGGYGIGTPYLDVPEIRDICLHQSLVQILDGIHGEPMGLHLNLTGWRSTQRGWHQDRYLNPPNVGNWYAAAWIALDDVHPDAGPFEWVPGSHRWPSIDQARMLAAMGEDGTDPDWPWRSERILDPLFAREIEARGAEVRQFLAKKGDVLVWHPNLAHRGSTPNDPTRERRALIAHYSVVSRRTDMPDVARHGAGRYFVLGPVA